MSPRSRILLLSNRYPDAEKPYAGWYIKAHAELLRDAGLEVMVLSPGSGSGSLLKKLEAQCSYLLKVVLALFKFKPDLVHAHWIMPSGLYALVFQKTRGIPFVLTSHGALVEEFDSYFMVTRWLSQRILRSADVIISVGRLHTEKVRAVVGRKDSRIETISMGIAIPAVDVRATIPPALQSITTPWFLFLGNLIPVKGPDVAIRALGILKANGIHCNLVIAGQGAMEHSLRALVADLGLEESVIFLGGIAHEQVPVIITSAVGCVVPSRREPFGLVAVEAMACGTPVIAADVGGLADNILQDETGLLFPPGDFEALADCMKRILNDPPLARKLGQGGKLAAERHSFKIRVREILAVYKGLGVVSGDE